MNEGGSILDSAEVDFLLGNDTGPVAAESQTAAGSQEVTMRGDLDQISLSDIFQTLAMSKMEGLLRVRNPLDHREVYFRDGYVRCLVPPRAETRRLGQMLIRAGLLSVEQLRTALLDQKQAKKRQHLGIYLVDQGLVAQESIEELVMTQLQEELFGLFTWQRGSFEFYKGAITDAMLAQRLELMPEFEITGVLMEVARRADEWETILAELGSLDELFRPCHQGGEEVEEEEYTVLDALDGTQTVRELADASVMSLFEVSRAMRTLSHDRMVERVPVADALDVCRGRIDRGELKRAGLLVHVLALRPVEETRPHRLELADLLARSGEAREAGELLLAAARETHGFDERLKLAREARRLGGRQLEILEFLRDQVGSAETQEDNEWFEITSDLADLRYEAGQIEEALDLLEELDELQPESPSIVSRRARALHRLDRVDEAVATLMPLVELFRREGRKDKLTAVYEQILKIDFRRKDVARALKRLHATGLQKHARSITLGALGVAGAVGGWLGWTWYDYSARLEALSAQVQELLDRDDVRAAQAAVQVFAEERGTSASLRSLEDTVRIRVSAAQKRRETSEERARQERIAEAGKRIEARDVAGALDEYAALVDEFGNEALVRKAARARLVVLTTDLRELAKKLEAALPPAPNLLQSLEERRAIVERLHQDFSPERRELASNTVAVGDREDLAATLEPHELTDLVAAAKAVGELFTRADAREQSYDDQIEKTETAKELQPLFYEARQLEARHAFDEALAAYRRLAAEYPDQDELAALFRERVERYEGILAAVGRIAAATESGDFLTARAELRRIAEIHSDIPFAELVELPLRVETTPAGATVMLDNDEVGKTPLVARFSPGRATRVRVLLDGFRPESTVLDGDTTDSFRSVLARDPSWSVETDATVERVPVADREGRVFVVDRGGNVTCVALSDGSVGWSVATGDLSGLLPTPVLTEKKSLIVASVDGPLRCLSVEDGTQLWRVDDLPAEAAPARLDREVFVATTDGRVAIVRQSDGTRIATVELEDEVVADLVVAESAHAVVVLTKNGTARALRKGGEVLWESRVGRGALTSPVLHGNLLVAATDDGSVTTLDVRTGSVLWRQNDVGELIHAPTVLQGVLCVPSRDRIHTFGLREGTPGPTFIGRAPWSAALATDGRHLFAPDRTGTIEVLVVRDGRLDPAYVLRGARAAEGPVVPLGDGWVLAAFGDRHLDAFHRLP
jgi:outer membrane protein assembly factor BamB/tetratricopeptide (TPR) repeat protein